MTGAEHYREAERLAEICRKNWRLENPGKNTATAGSSKSAAHPHSPARLIYTSEELDDE